MQRLVGNKGIDAIPPYDYGGMASIQVDILTALRIWGYALQGLKLLRDRIPVARTSGMHCLMESHPTSPYLAPMSIASLDP